VISGDHLHLNAGRPAGVDSGDRLGAGRVDHALQPQKDQTRLDVARGRGSADGRRLLSWRRRGPAVPPPCHRCDNLLNLFGDRASGNGLTLADPPSG
jgi:hypothetical protein